MRFTGIGVCPGIVIGRAYVHDPGDLEPPIRRIDRSELAGEIARFEKALLKTRQQILETQQKLAESIGSKDAAIFDAHLLVVEDDTITSEVVRRLEQELLRVDRVYYEVTQKYAQSLEAIDDAYLKERAHDLHDVARRVLRNLAGRRESSLSVLARDSIIVAQNLAPSETADLDPERIPALATDGGSVTSHAAIMARSLNIPAVVGLRQVSELCETGDEVILDGFHGVFILNPEEETRQKYETLRKKEGQLAEQLSLLQETRAETKDGRRIILSANIERKDDAGLVKLYGAEGIGLYRTEFLFMGRNRLPDEDEQYENYRTVVETVAPHEVIIRTLDLGGDKLPGTSALRQNEANPFLGWRGIRLCLERPDIFKPQLRAILRASATGSTRLMYPMISCLEELLAANRMLEECREEMRREQIPFDEKMQVGMMIELPSAALSAHILGEYVDFFSIGTNDLIQYTLGVDRTNELVSELYKPTHPSLVGLIHHVVEAARQHGIWVGVCGETAGDIVLTPLLLGLGVDELSVGASIVPRVKKAIQHLDYSRCQQLALEVQEMKRSHEIMERCRKMARENYPELV